ncbi:centromere protein P isoform X3 [Physeter macrocephalus]|uniref:Centromere protein P isoform X3 n=1 Tax=Physeter macrocephalus TaxID=9755 RepID=A0A9W2WW53_PHYMC|nr:centromere protein P isoform X3 [Physeter catodon]
MDSQRAEARALEAEISALRRACVEPPAPGEDTSRVRKSFRDIYQADSEGWELSKDLRSHLGHLESELQFLSTLTGISIRHYSKKTEDLTSTEMTEKSIKKVLQRHRLSGNCHMITFQLEFQLLEIQEKYPEAVHLSEGASSSCMGIRSPSRPGFELVIVWRIQIDEEGKVLPKLDLLTKVPLQALELDKNGVIEAAPLSFRTLLGVLGIEATLESLIKSLHTEASN